MKKIPSRSISKALPVAIKRAKGIDPSTTSSSLFGAKERKASKGHRQATSSLPFTWSPMAVMQASVLQSFPFRVAVFTLICVLLLPLFPSPQPTEGLAGWQALLAKAWELLHLLFVGIAVSYGLFSRRNDGGRRPDEKDGDAAAPADKPDARYVSRMLEDSLAFDDDGMLPESPGLVSDDGKVRSWNALHHPDEPVVMVATGGGGRTHAADAQQAALSLPVRTLKPQHAQPQVDSAAAGHSNGEPRGARPRRSSQDSADAHDTVLPSPIPWRSPSGRLGASRPASPRRLSPASSLSKETLAKASEEYSKRNRPYKPSVSSQPPPPPPFLVHGFHPAAERRTAAKSFKEELQDHSMRGRGDHLLQSPQSLNNSAYGGVGNSSPAKPRSSFDGSSSSAKPRGSFDSGAKSVRTIRPREGVQTKSQEQHDDAGDELGLYGQEEPYGYRAYQYIHRLYESGSSDPILGKVAVSSESSDDDVGGYSTRESTPEVDENEVDKKAEEFIARFREQIRLQRIESIKKSAGPRRVKHGK